MISRFYNYEGISLQSLKYKLRLLLFSVIIYSCSEIEELDIPSDIDNSSESNDIKTVKNILSDGGYDLSRFYVGTALNTNQLNTKIEKLFLDEFNYSTPENSAKQSIVHPEPGIWNWDRIESFLDFAKKNNIHVRIHGPIGPQSSKWAKNDSRTEDELLINMEEYMSSLSQKINNNSSVKWMDVVNETITTTGEWFTDKPGDDKWENPWTKIGLNQDGIPIYIERAFEIAYSLAPNVSLVYNQHGAMEKVMWDKVKETINYLRSKGYRVDGLGWQAHLKDWKVLSLNREKLDFLSDLIDWTHSKGMEFHITEIDYAIDEVPPTDHSLYRQANGYANILKVLISKRNNGVITYNTWGIVDKIDHLGRDQNKFLFDKNLNPKPVINYLRETLTTQNTELVILE